jgi:fumarate reductase subunit C
MPATWWLQKRPYTLFMIRDLTSVFIAGYCVFLMVLLYRANQSTESFRAFYEGLATPLSTVLHLIVLAFAVYHSVTFFNLTPRVMVVFRGEERVPDGVIAGAHYVAWAVISLVLILLAMAG